MYCINTVRKIKGALGILEGMNGKCQRERRGGGLLSDGHLGTQRQNLNRFSEDHIHFILKRKGFHASDVRFAILSTNLSSSWAEREEFESVDKVGVAGIPYWAESIGRLEMSALKLRAEARNRGE